ncbi:MAG: hypothetical protein IKU25_01915 [Clostridia bacterium]|nr:hypothetical protein [Clostridia bacterium]
MKKLISLLLVVITLLCIAACGANTDVATTTATTTVPNDYYTGVSLDEYLEDIFSSDGFKYVCSTDEQKNIVIEKDDAEEMYTYIMKQLAYAEEIKSDTTDGKSIYIVFQDGEPLLLSDQTDAPDDSAASADDLVAAKHRFYGVFWIYENDYAVHTGSPFMSFQAYYRMPEGTYEKVEEMLEKHKTALQDNPATTTTKPAGAVFDLNNVERITFYSHYGAGFGSDVPQEDMAEITAWLASFTFGEKAPEPVPPGTNTYYVEIEYRDGTVIKQGLDIIKIDGVSYELESDDAPLCLDNII